MPTRPPTLRTTGANHPTYPRTPPSARGYGREWQRVRLWKLAHSPLCEDCERDGKGPIEATEVDHVLAISKGGRHEPENLRSLCKSCHSKKTYRVDGGLGNRRN